MGLLVEAARLTHQAASLVFQNIPNLRLVVCLLKG